MSTRPRLLVVDNEAGIQRMMHRWAEREGFELIEATTSAGAFAAAKTEPPDLILLDPRLPDEHGLRLLERLKREPRTKNIPVVGWSGRESTTEEQDVIRAGAIAFFRKTDMGQLFQNLAELLQSS